MCGQCKDRRGRQWHVGWYWGDVWWHGRPAGAVAHVSTPMETLIGQQKIKRNIFATYTDVQNQLQTKKIQIQEFLSSGTDVAAGAAGGIAATATASAATFVFT